MLLRLTKRLVYSIVPGNMHVVPKASESIRLVNYMMKCSLSGFHCFSLGFRLQHALIQQ